MATRQRIRRTILFLFLIVFPLTINYYSPYLIIDAAMQGIASFSFLLWTTWFLSSLFFGRAGCGYFCPLGAGQETLHAMGDRPLLRIKYIRVLKYIITVLWVGLIVAGVIAAGGINSVHPLYMTEKFVSIDSVQGNILYFMVLSIALVPALLLGKRAFCHYLCPFGVLNIVGTRIGKFLHLPVLHLETDMNKCTKCGKCSKVCQMSLPVTDMVQSGSMENTECILCGMCVDNCKFDAIHYAWKPEK